MNIYGANELWRKWIFLWSKYYRCVRNTVEVGGNADKKDIRWWRLLVKPFSGMTPSPLIKPRTLTNTQKNSNLCISLHHLWRHCYFTLLENFPTTYVEYLSIALPNVVHRWWRRNIETFCQNSFTRPLISSITFSDRYLHQPNSYQ